MSELSYGEQLRQESIADEAAADARDAQQALDIAAGLWRSQDGRATKISNMADSHLRNALAMLKRKGFIGPSTLKAYLFGPKPRGEMAQEAYSQELDEVLGAKVNPYVDLLAAEMNRRGLTEVPHG